MSSVILMLQYLYWRCR